MTKLYSLSKASKLLGCSVRTLYRWKAAGKINFININGVNKVKFEEIKRLRGS